MLPFFSLKLNGLGWINCVRWNSDGSLLSSASDGGEVHVLDVTTGKIIHQGGGSKELLNFNSFN